VTFIITFFTQIRFDLHIVYCHQTLLSSTSWNFYFQYKNTLWSFLNCWKWIVERMYHLIVGRGMADDHFWKTSKKTDLDNYLVPAFLNKPKALRSFPKIYYLYFLHECNTKLDNARIAIQRPHFFTLLVSSSPVCNQPANPDERVLVRETRRSRVVIHDLYQWIEIIQDGISSDQWST